VSWRSRPRSEAVIRLLASILGAIGGFALGYAMIRAGDVHAPGSSMVVVLASLEGLIFCYLGAPYVTGGWHRVNLSLATTPLPDLLSGVAGMIVGLVVAALIGYFVRAFPYGVGLSAILALLLALMGAELGMTRRPELAALFGVSEARGSGRRRIQAALLDTSVIIDGRILDLVRTGFVDVPLVVMRSVLKELQQVADSADDLKRARGRRGLDILTLVEKEPEATFEVLDDDASGELDVDARLVRTAKNRNWAIMTTDFNLSRVAQVEGVRVLNLNDLGNAMKPIAIPGEVLHVVVVKAGNQKDQGVAYLDDGTMVVVDNGLRSLNEAIDVVVTSVLQTSAGRMIFALPAGPLAPARRPRRAPDTESAT